MEIIWCKLINEEGKVKSGMMCGMDSNFSFIDLISWVYRNCTGCLKIEINPEKEISVEFKDRFEIYSLREGEVC